MSRPAFILQGCGKVSLRGNGFQPHSGYHGPYYHFRSQIVRQGKGRSWPGAPMGIFFHSQGGDPWPMLILTWREQCKGGRWIIGWWREV